MARDHPSFALKEEEIKREKEEVMERDQERETERWRKNGDGEKEGKIEDKMA